MNKLDEILNNYREDRLEELKQELMQIREIFLAGVKVSDLHTLTNHPKKLIDIGSTHQWWIVEGEYIKGFTPFFTQALKDLEIFATARSLPEALILNIIWESLYTPAFIMLVIQFQQNKEQYLKQFKLDG